MNTKTNIFLLLSILLITMTSHSLWSQSGQEKTTRILFIIDGSSSMLEKWEQNNNRYQAGRLLVSDIMDSIYRYNPQVEFGLRVFGHNYTVDKNNCYDTKLETIFSPSNSDMVNGRLALIQPQGVSPIALSLKESAEMDIVNTQQYAYSLILITDGNESCGGDICDVMQKLINYKIAFTPYIISMNSDKNLVQQYDCMGEFMTVTQKSEFVPVIKKIMADNNNFIATKHTTFTPQQSYNSTLIEEIKKLNTPETTESTTKAMDPSKSTQAITKITNGIPVPRLSYSNNTLPKSQPITTSALPRFNFINDLEPSTTSSVSTPPAEQKKQLSKINQFTLHAHGLLPLTYNIPTTKAKTRPVDRLPLFNFPQESISSSRINLLEKANSIDIKNLAYKINTPQTQAINISPLPKYEFPKELIISNPKIGRQSPINMVINTLPYKAASLKISTIKVATLPKYNFPKEEQPVITKTPTETPKSTKPSEPTKPKYISLDPPKADPKDQKSTVTTEDKNDDQEPGTFQVYFTNGKGKYYNSSPTLRIKNLATGQQVHEAKRDIFQGVPTPITLPDGNYSITVVESGRTSQVVVEKGKNKRVEIIVGGGNIAFIYTGTNEVPQGYIATVSKRFEAGDIINHPSEIKLQYDPSNYHIEINTLPILMYNLDVEADGLTLVPIPKPGNIQIVNEEELPGRIEFWHNLAGQSYRFHEMSIYGDVEYQKVDLRPGSYEIRYPYITKDGERVMKIKTISLKSQQELKIKLD